MCEGELSRVGCAFPSGGDASGRAEEVEGEGPGRRAEFVGGSFLEEVEQARLLAR